jgi:hypothetical protein
MARSTETIKAQIQTTIRTYSSLDGFLFPSDPGGSAVSAFNALIEAVAIAINIFEQLLDVFNIEINQLVSSAPVHNTGNTRQKILNFQFGDVIELDSNFVPSYPVIDASKKIVTQCAVVNSDTDTLTIKVAKGTAPSLQPLASNELTALQDYFLGTAVSEGVGVAGVSVIWVNENSDKLFIEADIFYLGQFDEATVKTNVIAAINNYLDGFQSDTFNGELFMNKLVDQIQAVDGVSRVNLETVRGRADSVAFPDGTVVDTQGTYLSVSGYIVEETETGNTYNDTITMKLETLGT